MSRLEALLWQSMQHSGLLREAILEMVWPVISIRSCTRIQYLLRHVMNGLSVHGSGQTGHAQAVIRHAKGSLPFMMSLLWLASVPHLVERPSSRKQQRLISTDPEPN